MEACLNQGHMFAQGSETQTDFPNEIINILLYNQGLKIASVHSVWHRAAIWHLECCLQGVVESRWLITVTKPGWDKEEEIYCNNKDKFFTLYRGWRTKWFHYQVLLIKPLNSNRSEYWNVPMQSMLLSRVQELKIAPNRWLQWLFHTFIIL